MMKSRYLTCFLLQVGCFGFASFFVCDAVAREWRDLTGNFSVTAELVAVRGANVYLEKPDGEVIKVPLTALSDADQAFLKSRNRVVAPALESRKQTMPRPPSPASDSRRPYRILEQTVADFPSVIRRLDKVGFGGKAAAFVPNRPQLFYACNSAEIRLSFLDSDALEMSLGRNNDLSQVASVGVSPSGRYAVVCGSSGVVQAFEFEDTGRPISLFSSNLHKKAASCIAFFPDSQNVLTGGGDHTLRRWRVTDGRVDLAYEGFESNPRACAVTDDGRQVIGCDGGVCIVFDAESGTESHRFPVLVSGSGRPTPASAYGIAISADGSKLAVSTNYTRSDQAESGNRRWRVPRSDHPFGT